VTAVICMYGVAESFKSPFRKGVKIRLMNQKSAKQNNSLQKRRTLYDVIKDHQLIVVFVTLIISIFSIYYTKRYSPEYAIINKDATIAYQKGFTKYGLFIEKKAINEGYGMRPIFILSFRNEPDYFEISSRKALLSEVKQIGSNKYMLKLYETGGFGGNFLVESEFKIQAY
jgi:hypothetical protein